MAINKTGQVTLIKKKSGAEKFGQGVVDTGIDALTGLANMVGLGSAVESMFRRIGLKDRFPTSAEVTEIVLKIINSAKAKGTAELDELRNQLSEIPLVKSSIQQGVIDKRIDQLKREIKVKSADVALADDMAQIALEKANSINWATSGQKKEIAEDAKKAALEAANAYKHNTVNVNSVDKEI